MARRGYIGGGRPRMQFDPSVFLRGDGGSDKGMEMAMTLLGYGKGGGPQDRALDRALNEQQQAWAEKYQAGQLNLQELQQKAAEANYKSEAEARTAAASNAAQARIDEAAKQANLEKFQAGQLDYWKTKADRDAAVEVFKSAVERGLTERDSAGKLNPQYAVLAEAAMPGYIEKSAAAKKGIFEQDVAAKLAEYQAADPKKRAAIDKNPVGSNFPADVYGEVIKRANLNAAQPGAPAAGPDERGIRIPLGVQTSLHIPLPPLSVGDARDYSKFPGSVEDLIRASGQPQPESRFAQPAQSPAAPAVASAVQPPQSVGYGQDDAGPQWQYGTGTQAIPQAPIAVPQVPRNTMVDDLLRKALQEKQAAVQEMPWMYGNEGWPSSQPLPGPTPLPRELLQ